MRPDAALMAYKDTLIASGYDVCDGFIQEYKEGRLQTQSGCNLEESLEALITGKLSGVRTRTDGMVVSREGTG